MSNKVQMDMKKLMEDVKNGNIKPDIMDMMKNMGNQKPDLKVMSKEERRNLLRQKLRNKIKSKRSNRQSKTERLSDAKEHISKLQEANISCEEYLSSMFKDPRQRKANKKRIKKLFNEADLKKQIEEKNKPKKSKNKKYKNIKKDISKNKSDLKNNE